MEGQYAFTVNGYDDQGFAVVLGSFTADGEGNITAGSVDVNGARFGSSPSYAEIVAEGSSYSVGSDHRGCAMIATTSGTLQIRFSVGWTFNGIANRGRVISWGEQNSTMVIAAGQIRKQNPASFETSLSGNYIFRAAGSLPAESTQTNMSCLGVLSIDDGAFTAGEQDCNDGAEVEHITDLTGGYENFDANGRTAFTMTSDENGTSDNVMYQISDSELLMMSAEPVGDGPLMAGEILKQYGTLNDESLDGASVFYASGVGGGGGSKAMLGIITADGEGEVGVHGSQTTQEGLEAINQSGVTYEVAANGRTILSGTGSPMMYLSGTNSGFFMTIGQAVTSGYVEPQSGGPFGNSSADDTYFFGTLAVFNQSQAGIGVLILDGEGNVEGTNDFVSTGGLSVGESITDTMTISADGTFVVDGGDNPGILISPFKWVMIDSPTDTPSLLVGETLVEPI